MLPAEAEVEKPSRHSYLGENKEFSLTVLLLHEKPKTMVTHLYWVPTSVVTKSFLKSSMSEEVRSSEKECTGGNS